MLIRTKGRKIGLFSLINNYHQKRQCFIISTLTVRADHWFNTDLVSFLVHFCLFQTRSGEDLGVRVMGGYSASISWLPRSSRRASLEETKTSFFLCVWWWGDPPSPHSQFFSCLSLVGQHLSNSADAQHKQIVWRKCWSEQKVEKIRLISSITIENGGFSSFQHWPIKDSNKPPPPPPESASESTENTFTAPDLMTNSLQKGMMIGNMTRIDRASRRCVRTGCQADSHNDCLDHNESKANNQHTLLASSMETKSIPPFGEIRSISGEYHGREKERKGRQDSLRFVMPRRLTPILRRPWSSSRREDERYGTVDRFLHQEQKFRPST